MKNIPVLFENEFCMVLNKPSGLAAQGGKGVGVSLDSILSAAYTPRPLLVHRLDRDTSGLILVAKTKEAAAGFSAIFAGSFRGGGQSRESGRGGKRPVEKLYLGVCRGVPETAAPAERRKSGAADASPARGIIRLDLDVRGKRKKSETFFRILSGGTAGECVFSLLELELGTGRMHQIRRHLAQSGFPLLGDDKYGDFSLNRELKKTSGLKHLLLHASRLIIPPSPGLTPEGLDITAPLPPYFSAFTGA